jgi:alkanesulfonate monooxygenase SsuD/methylene tetrahydromethanopterin reductase-like flavin-dependent oxidoreductase (luciferase family)
VFADFINPRGAQLMRYYRRQTPSPRSAVASWAICADTDEEAERLSLSFRMMMTLLFRGQSIRVPTVERARQFLEDEGLLVDQVPAGRRIITGTPARVREAIEAVAREYEAEEVLIVNILHDHAARRRSYELIAKEFGMDN